jgi:Zn-dependent alcohol dehydrogenase
VKVRKNAPLELFGPLGCGIQTGAGTVLRALQVGAGASFVVMGAGTVGLSAVMAARVAGATTQATASPPCSSHCSACTCRVVSVRPAGPLLRFDEINQAAEDTESGTVVKPIIRIS